MCGRYYFGDPEEYPLIEWIAESLGGQEFRTGEVFPTNNCAVLCGNSKGGFVPKVMKWGFLGFKGRYDLINARAETAAAKPTFRRPFEASRILVPMSAYYEWNASKKKVKFYRSPPEALFAAGLSTVYKGEALEHFVILTTAANESASDVHSRMPLLLSEEEAVSWLEDTSAALALAASEPRALLRQMAS